MAEASIPVDPTNPGQVFACLGLMEAAEILLGDAEGGFDWSGPETRFRLAAAGQDDPVEAVLGFLDRAEVRVLAPARVSGDWPKHAVTADTFPSSGYASGAGGKPMSVSALPIVLATAEHKIPISHWADASGRDTFKLFAGQQQGHSIFTELLGRGRQAKGVVTLRTLMTHARDLCRDPFGPAGPTKTAFGFDARGAWDALRSGVGLDALSIQTRTSPVVDLLAALGLEHSRPVSERGGTVRYAIWTCALPTVLARAALAGLDGIVRTGATRRFRTHTGPSQYYKKFYYASEE